MNRKLAVVVMTLMVGTSGVALAQDANGNNPAMSPKARLERQHDRIQEGKENGTISRKEARKLRHSGRKINQERKKDLAKDGGKLTNEDRAKLEHRENERSKKIYEDKHN